MAHAFDLPTVTLGLFIFLQTKALLTETNYTKHQNLFPNALEQKLQTICFQY